MISESYRPGKTHPGCDGPTPLPAGLSFSVADGIAGDIRRGAAWFGFCLGGASVIRLALEPQYWTGPYLAWLGVLVGYLVLQRRILRRSEPRSIRLGLFVNFAAINLGYALIGAAMNSARGWRADAALYRAERFLFAGDPQRFLTSWRAPWLSTVAILGYVAFVGFLAYLFLAEAFVLSPATGRLQAGLMRLYGLGFSGYLLLPAAGPIFHHPAWLASVPQSALSAYLNSWIVRCASRVDVWPSLHAAVCCFALVWTFRRHRRAFFALLLPSAALLFGTVYLQYHYFVDLLSGVPLGAACALFALRDRVQAEARVR